MDEHPDADAGPAAASAVEQTGTQWPALRAQVSKQRNEIDECILAITTERLLQSAYPRINTDRCDTAILLDAPPKGPEHSHLEYEVIRRHYDHVFPASSNILKEYSPTVFAPMFEPKKQNKYRDRLYTKLTFPATWVPKYVIDLTPSAEGDDATQLLMDLCCPQTVSLWHLSNTRFNCPKDIVCGTEEFAKMRARFKDNDDDEKEEEPQNTEFAYVPDYTQVRHYRGIERLILTLHGEEIDLDSAVKLYTTAALAHHFQIVNGGPLQELASAWISHPQNRFLTIAPEASLKIADWLHSGHVARDAFAILVGEAAQDSACGSMGSPRTWAGRNRGDIDEIWQTRVQYARESFEQRITVCFESLTDESMHWVEALPEVKKLVSVRDELKRSAPKSAALKSVQAQIDLLKKTVRRCIFLCLCPTMASPELRSNTPSASGHHLHPEADPLYMWNAMPWRARIFTGTFWRLLSSMNMARLAFHKPQSGYQLTSSRPAEFIFKTWTARSRLALREAGVWEDDPSLSASTASELDIEESMDRDQRPAWNLSSFTSDTDHVAWAENHPEVPDEELLVMRQSLTSALTLQLRGFRMVQGPHSAGDPSTQIPTLGPQDGPAKVQRFFREVEQALKSKATSMLNGPPELTISAQSVRILNVLVCLDEDEIQCLPLWAGGCDDGTGGVFSNAVTSSEERFTGGAEFVRDMDEDGFENMTITNSEVPTSCIVHDGHSEQLDRRRVYAASEVESEESFGVVDDAWTIAEEMDVRSETSDTPTLRDGADDDFTDIFMNSDGSDDEL